MLHVILYQPEIPPNTGNIIRLCANTGAKLHLVHPLGFELSEKSLRRAGLDYHGWAEICEYDDFMALIKNSGIKRFFACSTKGKTLYSDVKYKNNDGFILGPESRGLPDHVRESDLMSNVIKLPMKTEDRSINLSNACAIILYEAWKQLKFK